jgi:hypothetical protein
MILSLPLANTAGGNQSMFESTNGGSKKKSKSAKKNKSTKKGKSAKKTKTSKKKNASITTKCKRRILFTDKYKFNPTFKI